MTDMHALTHYTPDFTKLAATIPKHQRQKLKRALKDLRNEAVMKTWLLDQGLQEYYLQR